MNIFQNKISLPLLKVVKPASGSLTQIKVQPSTSQIRPYVVGAILRNITFTQSRYESFIDLQDKLHNNICRKRTLVAIGTHDLDTVEGPFEYNALSPEQIKFTPLNQTQEMDGNKLMEFYEKDRHLGKFLHIIRDSPVYPVIFDNQKRVCSLPPIINGEHSKITLNTRNVFIECTATDLTKAKVVLNTMIAMFGKYCEEPFTVEPVEVVYPDGATHVYPDVSLRSLTVKPDYINAAAGINITPPEMVEYLKRMSLLAEVDQSGDILVQVPPTRSDILHACDVMEDVAIAYGYNNITKTMPGANTVGGPLPINKLSDLIRRELAFGGWSEVLSLILCSHDENYAFLNKEDPKKEAILLANPKTVEYQVVRTSLLPGLLKTIHSNRKSALPVKVFEASDVAFQDYSRERNCRNERHVALVYCNKSSGFEYVHGELNRLMDMLSVRLVSSNPASGPGYFIESSDHPTYFPGRSAKILLRTSSNEVIEIGHFGILHPQVLKNFEITYVASALEFNLEPFL